jgi:alpha-ribazole phosphatase
LILIRHGETAWNVEGRYQGQSDVSLNARGKAQIAALGERLRLEKIDQIYSSDLARAVETAQVVAGASDAPLIFDPRLREIDQGEWEGRLLEEIKAADPEAYARRRGDPTNLAPPGGETVGQVQKRVLEALKEILSRHQQGTVAIVSHGLALAIVKIHLEGRPIDEVWHFIPPNAEPETYDVEDP